MLPPPDGVTGFRLAPRTSKAPYTATSGRRRNFRRAADGMQIEFRVWNQPTRISLAAQGERLLERWIRLGKATFSGLPLGEWVRTTPRPYRSGCYLAVVQTPWLLTAEISHPNPRRVIRQRDLFLVERVIRESLSRKMTPSRTKHPQTYPYVLLGRQAKDCYQYNGVRYVPAAPILRAAGLEVRRDRDLPVVRGWKGKQLVATVIVSAKQMKIRGRMIDLPSYCWQHEGKIYVPVSELATQLGMQTFITGPKPEFHVQTGDFKPRRPVVQRRLPVATGRKRQSRKR